MQEAYFFLCTVYYMFTENAQIIWSRSIQISKYRNFCLESIHRISTIVIQAFFQNEAVTGSGTFTDGNS